LFNEGETMPAPAHRGSPLASATVGALAIAALAALVACGPKEYPRPAPSYDDASGGTGGGGSRQDSAPSPSVDAPAAPQDGVPVVSTADGGAPDKTVDAAPRTPDGPAPCDPACSATEVCKDGQCTSVCHDGEALCKNGCSDLMTDPLNCGHCEKPCAAGQFCSSGQCVMACAMDEARCGASCVKLLTNPRHCGMCPTSCSGAEGCVQGACTCVAPNQVCDGACISLNNNRDHCGSCNNKCNGDFVCNGKTCGCPGGRKECPNKARTCVTNLDDCCPGNQSWCGASGCVDTANDRNHCGGCNAAACKGVEVCSGGKCGCPDSQPRACGGGVCVLAGQCCPNEMTCPGTPARCVPKGGCCTGDHLCPDKPDLCVASVAECCQGQKDCGGGHCVANDACCPPQVGCPGVTPTKCIDPAHPEQCCDPGSQDFCAATKKCIPKGSCCDAGACPLAGQVCSGGGSPACTCPDKTKECAAAKKCISTAPGSCCADADCGPGATCGDGNKCVCGMNQHMCPDGSCHECCGDMDCKDPAKPTCGPDKTCVAPVCTIMCAMGNRCVAEKGDCCPGPNSTPCGSPVQCCRGLEICQPDGQCRVLGVDPP
jgi:hypothetical protein